MFHSPVICDLLLTLPTYDEFDHVLIQPSRIDYVRGSVVIELLPRISVRGFLRCGRVVDILGEEGVRKITPEFRTGRNDIENFIRLRVSPAVISELEECTVTTVVEMGQPDRAADRSPKLILPEWRRR